MSLLVDPRVLGSKSFEDLDNNGLVPKEHVQQQVEAAILKSDNVMYAPCTAYDGGSASRQVNLLNEGTQNVYWNIDPALIEFNAKIYNAGNRSSIDAHSNQTLEINDQFNDYDGGSTFNWIRFQNTMKALYEFSSGSNMAHTIVIPQQLIGYVVRINSYYARRYHSSFIKHDKSIDNSGDWYFLSRTNSNSLVSDTGYLGHAYIPYTPTKPTNNFHLYANMALREGSSQVSQTLTIEGVYIKYRLV